MSYKYYDEHATEYYEGSISADMTPTYTRFIKYLSKNALILDAGSGTGRDTKAFLEMGYSVEAFDASIEMVKISSQYTGVETRHLKFEDMDYTERFDGIWACASLLHVERRNIPSVFESLKKALKQNGVLYCSFKLRANDFIKDGRSFTCFSSNQFTEFIDKIGCFTILELWESGDVRENRNDELWVNCILR